VIDLPVPSAYSIAKSVSVFLDKTAQLPTRMHTRSALMPIGFVMAHWLPNELTKAIASNELSYFCTSNQASVLPIHVALNTTQMGRSGASKNGEYKCMRNRETHT
jgi:hypothetical protein